MKISIQQIILLGGIAASVANAVPSTITAPVTGPVRLGSTAMTGFWVFNQHQTGFHTSSGGIGGADDRFAWDANLYLSGNSNADQGKPVLAIADGVIDTVAHKNWAGSSYGQILLRHVDASGKTYYSGYLHLSGMIAKTNGAFVAAGTQLGLVSRTSPNAVPDHLHFAVYDMINGKLVSKNATIVERPNRPPVIASVSAWASAGAITVTGATSDPDGDPIAQLDLWVIDAATGAAVADSLVRFMQGGFTPGSFRKEWTPAFLSTRIQKSGSYKIGLRSIDSRNGKVEMTTAPFWYDRPVPAAPEIDIKQNGTSLASGKTASIIPCKVGSTGTATFTLHNTGKADLKISSWSLTNSRFAASLTTTTIKPGYSGTITVRFTPTATGYTTSTLTIRNNDADESSYVICLRGYGTK